MWNSTGPWHNEIQILFTLLNDVRRNVNEDLERIFEWLSSNKLKLNVDKTKCLEMYTGIKDNIISVKINDQPIEVVKCIKYT